MSLQSMTASPQRPPPLNTFMPKMQADYTMQPYGKAMPDRQVPFVCVGFDLEGQRNIHSRIHVT